MLSMVVAVPVDTLFDTLTMFYSHQHAQYTLLDTWHGLFQEQHKSASRSSTAWACNADATGFRRGLLVVVSGSRTSVRTGFRVDVLQGCRGY